MEENEKSNFLMSVSDPEMVQKIRESGIEGLSSDELNSLGMEGTNRIRIKTIADHDRAPAPPRRGFVRFIAILIVLLIVLSTIGIICCKMNPRVSLTNKDMFFLSLFIVVGLGLCSNEFRVASASKRYLTEFVSGKCISHDVSRNSFPPPKRSVFEYTYRGKVYRSCESVYANKGYANIGEVRKLMISPENPRQIYDPVAGKARKKGSIMIGMIFIGLPLVILVSQFFFV